jgi:hypothetical protein
VANACPEYYRIKPSDIILEVNNRGRRSCGGIKNGKPYTSIKPKKYDKHDSGAYYFHEYANIKSDGKIGAFYSTSFENSLLAIVAHEYAHVVQFCNREMASGYHGISPASFDKPHGHGWQAVYAELRQALGLTTKDVGIFVTKQEAKTYVLDNLRQDLFNKDTPRQIACGS